MLPAIRSLTGVFSSHQVCPRREQNTTPCGEIISCVLRSAPVKSLAPGPGTHAVHAAGDVIYATEGQTRCQAAAKKSFPP